MIVLKDKETKEIVEIFDTAKDLKEYVIAELEQIDKSLREDGAPLYDSSTEPKNVCFRTNLAMYCDIDNTTVNFV
jgi:predicted Zn-ribbon and HTH transcriptional regulator